MNILLFILTIPLLILFARLIIHLITLKESKREYLKIPLKAIKTHENRGLQFSKGKIYTFYKNGDKLTIDYDDNNSSRDIYSFYKKDLMNGFKPIDILGKMVLNNEIKEI